MTAIAWRQREDRPVVHWNAASLSLIHTLHSGGMLAVTSDTTKWWPPYDVVPQCWHSFEFLNDLNQPQTTCTKVS